jgi:hypothetical protein
MFVNILKLLLQDRDVAQFGLAHQYGVLGAGGSNPLIPTIFIMAA